MNSSSETTLSTKSDQKIGKRYLVIVPTYNEVANIEAILTHVLSLPPKFDVLVIEDGSPDGTADVVRKSMAKHPDRVKMIEREGKLGLGTAYIRGFRFGIEENYDWILQMDADFSHNPDDLVRLLDAGLDGHDLVIGSRYIEGFGIVNWPLNRLLLSYGAGVYTRTITGIPIKDVTAGFKCISREVLRALNLDKITSNGYSFQIDVNFRVWKKGFTIKEVPIIFTERVQGNSKMNKAIIGEAILKVWELRFRSLFGKL